MNVRVVVRFEVLIMVFLNTPVFWDVSMCQIGGYVSIVGAWLTSTCSWRWRLSEPSQHQ